MVYYHFAAKRVRSSAVKTIGISLAHVKVYIHVHVLGHMIGLLYAFNYMLSAE